MGKEQVRAIQFFVANAVEGLAADRVSVTNSKGELMSEEPGDESSSFMSDRQLESRRNLEAYLSRKAEDMLNTVLGAGNAIVRVSAEVNRDTITRTDITYDADPVARSSTETIETTSTQASVDSSLFAGGTTNTNAPVSAPEVKLTERNTKESEFAVGSKTNDIVQVPGGIKYVTAAVFVAKKQETQEDGTVTYQDRDSK